MTLVCKTMNENYSSSHFLRNNWLERNSTNQFWSGKLSFLLYTFFYEGGPLHQFFSKTSSFQLKFCENCYISEVLACNLHICLPCQEFNSLKRLDTKIKDSTASRVKTWTRHRRRLELKLNANYSERTRTRRCHDSDSTSRSTTRGHSGSERHVELQRKNKC